MKGAQIPHIPGIDKLPDLAQQYRNEWTREHARCVGDCFSQQVVRKYYAMLKQRLSTKARP